MLLAGERKVRLDVACSRGVQPLTALIPKQVSNGA